MDRMTFLHPVHVGELLSCSATVNAVWRSSMEVGVRVEAENPHTGERRHTSTAYLTMVATRKADRPLLPRSQRRARRRGVASGRRSFAAATDWESGRRS